MSIAEQPFMSAVTGIRQYPLAPEHCNTNLVALDILDNVACIAAHVLL